MALTDNNLVAITRRGRNHIDRHGASWAIVKTVDAVRFDARPGPWLLLESRATGFLLWVHGNADADHEFKEGG